MATLERVARDICAERGLDFVEILGEGAFKETYHVVSGEGHDVALKLFKSGHSAERSRREIEAMQRCSHPSVGRVLEVGEHGAAASRVLFVIEEYLGGGTLTQRLTAAGRLQPSEVQDLGSALIAAVSHIASLELVHRDIKPDNILFRQGEAAPVIVDFGLVRDLTSGSLTATWFAQGPGTPYFAAPEQLNNRKDLIDWRTDQFAVGVVLSIAAWGRHPY